MAHQDWGLDERVLRDLETTRGGLRALVAMALALAMIYVLVALALIF